MKYERRKVRYDRSSADHSCSGNDANARSISARNPTFIFVCVTCGKPGNIHAGKDLFTKLSTQISEVDGLVLIRPVECLAACDRPVSIAFHRDGCWSYIVSGVDPSRDANDVLDAARAVAASANGIPTMEQRPPFFRRGVVARMPPAPNLKNCKTDLGSSSRAEGRPNRIRCEIPKCLSLRVQSKASLI